MNNEQALRDAFQALRGSGSVSIPYGEGGARAVAQVAQAEGLACEVVEVGLDWPVDAAPGGRAAGADRFEALKRQARLLEERSPRALMDSLRLIESDAAAQACLLRSSRPAGEDGKAEYDEVVLRPGSLRAARYVWTRGEGRAAVPATYTYGELNRILEVFADSAQAPPPKASKAA